MAAAPIRPRRSVLYMPAANARALEKAQTLDADGFIFDLEDAVAPDAKVAARDQLARALAGFDYRGRERVVRVNGLDTPWAADDLRMAARSGADAVLVPKVESAAALLAAEAALVDAGAPVGMALWAMMETPRAFLRADEIAGATPRLACLAMGTSDLAHELRALHTPDRIAFLPSLGLGLLAARAHGLAALDGVHLDLSDDAGFEAACRQALVLGFDGKTLIHPKTIAGANAVFSPDPARIAWAERVTAAHAAAEAAGKGVVLVDGKLIENLHVAEAQRLLALANAIGN
ncbi:citrate lyase subunit beta/citryl-CoA lyase [Stella humosa]|uniref:Citrate lyase subunit beta/citryl-CoA lyase n=2 Tax=Stella humosa TaxID=94 RepID=A0A3N1LKJ4_9PROT|nr:CoA ester lyase [Stella humosa]ROP91259.1 citrate lyase subunit beta/citryl-CoA lyase [Stella humosa]